MDFESLIWIIVVLIYVVSAILKKKRVAPTPEKADAGREPPGWKVKLDKYLSQVKQEIKTGLEDTSEEKELGWDKILGKKARSEAPEQPIAEDPVWEEVPIPVEKPSFETMRKVIEKASPVKTEPKTDVFPAGVSGFSIKDLQNAVIWSEILGPPVALRKSHEK